MRLVLDDLVEIVAQTLSDDFLDNIEDEGKGM